MLLLSSWLKRGLGGPDSLPLSEAPLSGMHIASGGAGGVD